MTTLTLSMLWESVEPHGALAQRFRFASPEEAARWLTGVLLHTYDLQVTSVDRLVISSYNLLAWLTTTDGALIAKCCGFMSAHPQLVALGELTVWLHHHGLPVSPPLAAHTGEVQVICEHLSLGVQRLIPGILLDPTQLEQSHSAGMTLAQLHQTLAVYSHVNQCNYRPTILSLAAGLNEWVERKRSAITEPALSAGVQALIRRLGSLDDTNLSAQFVHNDYRAANILWNDGKICAVLDFEELRLGYRVNDLAWAAVHLGTRFRNWGPVSTQVHAAFLGGYEALHPLTDVEQAWLPLLMAWHSINLANSASGGSTYAACVDSAKTYARRLKADQNGI